MRPNVLLLVLDAARRDAFEPYGAAPGATPATAQLARRGRALPDVHATGCWTVPSHASLFTGLLPRAAGLAKAPGGRPHGCRPVIEAQAERFLPEVLRRSGYATAAVSTNLWLSPESGFATGFDEFVSTDSGRQGGIHGETLRDRLRWGAEAVLARADDGARKAAQTIDQWVARPPRQPFFWFVNLVECHSPYLPPRPYADLSPLDLLRAAEEARRHLTLGAIWRACAGGFDVPEEALARMRHLYARAVRYMDDWLARVLESLDRARLLEDTLVIVTADHGENFGEGGLIGHGLSLDERLLHVPFVAAGPGMPSDDGFRSLAELPRVLAEATSLQESPWRTGDLPAGAALAQFDPPTSRDDPRAQQAVAEWGLGEEALGRLTTPLACATDGRLKLLRRGEAEELYDLAADPFELRPHAAGDGPEVDVLRRALDHPAMGEHAPPMGDHAPPTESLPSEPSAEELREIEERMRLLGYL